MTNVEKIACLRPFVSEHKQRLVDEVLSQRTRHITLVFEDIDKAHNISAVLRTAECMGVQDIHLIKNKNEYRANPDITMGAAKWLTLHEYNKSVDGKENVKAAYTSLRSKGYRIYATTVNQDAPSIYDLDATDKTAIVFGTEGTGISEDTASSADGLVKIPMRGFTESFNLSVSASIVMTVLMRNYSPEWLISEEERQELQAEYYRKIVRAADRILARGL